MNTRNDLDGALGAMLFIGIHGTTCSEDTARMLESLRPGGVILFARNVAKKRRNFPFGNRKKRNFVDLQRVEQLVRDLRDAHPDPDLLIGIDQEGGRVQRLREPFPQLPPMAELGRQDDIEKTKNAVRVQAEALRELGINVNFSPVMDIHSNPNNPVIGDRSFGERREIVSRHGVAVIEAMASVGVASCAKHFPGHGDTEIDSHLGLPVVKQVRKTLEEREFHPFREAVKAGVPMVMTAHIIFPSLDPIHPATMSKEIITGRLREAMDFEGVVVSDDMEMGAMRDHYSFERALSQSMGAGVDMWLICADSSLQSRAKQIILDGVANGDWSEERIFQSATRVRRVATRYNIL